MQEIQISMREIQGKSKMGLISNIVHYSDAFYKLLFHRLGLNEEPKKTTAIASYDFI